VSAGFRLAYVAYAFPVLTQTFTTREVLALAALDIDVRVHASRDDAAALLDPLAESARPMATYLPPALSGAACAALVRWSVRRPVRLLATLFACLGGGYRDQPVRSRLRSLRHFALGVVLASRLRSEGGYDHVHAQFLDAGSTLAFVAARLTDLPFTVTNHTAYNPFLLRPKARHARAMISISEFDRQGVEREAPEARGKTEVCRVGIRTADWVGLPREPEPGRLLSVAALRTKKGHAELLSAVAQLRRDGVDVRVVLAGDGAERARLAEQAYTLGIGVEMLGAVGPERVREELSRADAFVLPCRIAPNGDLDGIPVAIMEAMAAGVPVVTTRISGVPELVEDGVTGYLAEPGDVESLVDALRRCLDGADERAQILKRAQRRVMQQHDIDRTSAALARVLRGEVPA
jgi:glycosyltransferase involved in cell wall biosynthesis